MDTSAVLEAIGWAEDELYTGVFWRGGTEFTVKEVVFPDEDSVYVILEVGGDTYQVVGTRSQSSWDSVDIRVTWDSAVKVELTNVQRTEFIPLGPIDTTVLAKAILDAIGEGDYGWSEIYEDIETSVGKVEYIDRKSGGEGNTGAVWVVVKLGDQHYKKDGYYASWDGHTWDGEFYPVDAVVVPRREWQKA